MDCILNVDSITDVKKKIWLENQSDVSHLDHRQLDLYSLASPVKDALTNEKLIHLRPR